MKSVLLQAVLLLTVSALALVTPANAQQRSEAPLTNAAVVKLVRAGFKEKTVIAIIHSRPSSFDLAPERLIDLKRNGVSENIILTMLSLDGSDVSSDDGWVDDDTFFKRKSTGASGGGSDPGTEIFGSGGESRSKSKSQSMEGSGSGETMTTGSASVRILRPPTEAGTNGQPRLVKTPTLNNDAIMTLVEAGFSEGTIIKRIENSPADFDLSPNKVQELRKRRVSDPIIAAMNAAMEDADPKTGSNPGSEN